MMADGARNRIGLAIVDDHAVVRQGLAAFIQHAGDIELLAMASTAAEAVEIAALHVLDVFLVDLLMPEAKAADTVRRIKGISPRTQIVILTSHEGDEHVTDVLEAGAISYILKDCEPADLIQAIRATGRGEPMLSPRISRALLARFSRRTLEPLPHDDLTKRELEVLQSIASGLSNQAISVQLGIAEKTVKAHVGNILSKLYLRDHTQAAIYAWREGLVDKS